MPEEKMTLTSFIQEMMEEADFDGSREIEFFTGYGEKAELLSVYRDGDKLILDIGSGDEDIPEGLIDG